MQFFMIKSPPQVTDSRKMEDTLDNTLTLFDFIYILISSKMFQVVFSFIFMFCFMWKFAKTTKKKKHQQSHLGFSLAYTPVCHPQVFSFPEPARIDPRRSECWRLRACRRGADRWYSSVIVCSAADGWWARLPWHSSLSRSQMLPQQCSDLETVPAHQSPATAPRAPRLMTPLNEVRFPRERFCFFVFVLFFLKCWHTRLCRRGCVLLSLPLEFRLSPRTRASRAPSKRIM